MRLNLHRWSLIYSLLVFLTLNSFAQVDYKINFSDQSTPPPAGWIQDYGQAYGAKGNLTYGWLAQETDHPIDLTGNGRNRPSTTDDLILETFMHMQYAGNPNGGNSTVGYWEMAVPNGTYVVGVSVGDLQFDDSEHVVNVEGVNMLFFEQTNSEKTATVEKIVTVNDGKITVDAVTGRNTKISSITILSPVPSPQPKVLGSVPTDGETNVSLTTTISANNLDFPNNTDNDGAGLDNYSVTKFTTQLFEVNGDELIRIPANVNGTGGGDAINLTPIGGLKPNTTYRYMINGTKDVAGYLFEPYSITFTTGAGSTQQTSLDDVAFTNRGAVASGSKYTSLVIGPDGKLYGLTITGYIHRWTINSDGTLSSRQILNSLVAKRGERAAVGLIFDSNSTATNLIAYVTHCSMELDGAPEWDGNMSKLSGSNLQNEQLMLTRLPRSIRDHLVNSIAIRPSEPNVLYINMSSNSAGGAPDGAWGNRPERLLAASLLKVDLDILNTYNLPLNVETTMDQDLINAVSVNSQTTADGKYNPYYVNAPVTMYATGIRNAYDLVWHSNGQMYIPTNGTAGGSNSPASVDGTRRPDGTFYNYSNPQTPQVPGVRRNDVQRDFLFRIDPRDPYGYYGHPNPLRGEYVLNRGTVDTKRYPPGVTADPNYRGFAFDFEFNKSPNGVIEYRNQDVFGGALAGALLVCRYSNGDDLIALIPDGPNGDIGTSKELIPGFTGFVDPLDVVEDITTGNIYVAEYFEHQEGGRISLLTPNDVVVNPAPSVSFDTPANGENFPVGTDLYVRVSATDNGSIDNVKLYLDGQLVRQERGAPYEWGDANQHTDPLLQDMQAGSYMLRAVATDNEGRTGEATITITIGDGGTGGNAAPTVAFIAPTNGETFPVGTDLYVNVDATDSDGTVSKVELFLDGVLVRAEGLAPYEWGDPNQNNDTPLQNLQAGTYSLRAVATDNQGETGEATISITVTNDNGGGGSDGVVRFVEPVDGQTFAVGSDIYVLIEPVGDASIKQIDLYLDDEGIRREKVPPYEWGDDGQNNDEELLNMQAGTYVLEARVTENDGTTSTESITITVGGGNGGGGGDDNTAPTVAFDTPTNNQTFTEGDDVYVKVNASDSDGTVSQVDLYLDNVLVRTEGVAPYEWGDPNQNNDTPLQNMQVGTYTLKVVATDNEGATSEASIQIVVEADDDGGGNGGGGSTQFGEALPWVEPFSDAANGVTSEGGPTSWKTRITNMLSGGSSGVSNGAYTVTGSSTDWFSLAIDVSEVSSVTISADVEGIGSLEPKDDIKMAYKIDGGKWLLWARPTGAFTRMNVSDVVNLPSGARKIEIAFRITKLDTDETFIVDNISVVAGSSANENETIEQRSEEVDFYDTAPFVVYPNPASEEVWVSLAPVMDEAVTLSIINANGQVLATQQLTIDHAARTKVNLTAYPAGLYFIELRTSEDSRYTESVLIER